eukprot:TRINITY_DN4081_c0_g1_i1.p1 TRINITY_DN4081_c0_g1~~TRINITY_DN4081_c0_g1_i1.p1  ORF type:complete len:293 (-),score=60.18 TRINITY_DN4081_c0_g1_i1:19-897(-)
MSIEIELFRANKIYRPGDVVQGVIVVTSRSGLSHNGITITLTGAVELTVSARSVGLFDAFYNSLKPVPLVDLSSSIEGGKVKGSVEYPFEFILQPLSGQELFETYHGVYVNVEYTLQADLKAGFFGKNLSTDLEFLVELEPVPISSLEIKPDEFSISPSSVENTPKDLPDFSLKGSYVTTICPITQPLEGHLTLEHCSGQIKSIELQLIRVEMSGCADGFAKEATEIQNIQICDGDIPRNWPIPIHMTFPRLFTCPTSSAATFKIDFECNVMVRFSNGVHVSHNTPLTLIRA